MEDQKELQIPVFTVWKNKAILKNIFLINAPPSQTKTQQQNYKNSETQLQNYENSKTHQQNDGEIKNQKLVDENSKTQQQNCENSKTHQQNDGEIKTQKLIDENSKTQQQNDENSKTHQEFEEILVVGRHPDCDIRLEHPSISRFHLRIHSKPSTKHLALIDLSSVHGTFVSGRRIEPNVKTTINESDTLRIGGSSRIYKLHWIPVSRAYDVSNPFVPPLDLVVLQEDDEEEQIIKDDTPLENEVIQAVDIVSNGLESVDSCDNKNSSVEQVAPITEEKAVIIENKCVESIFPDLPSEEVNSELVVGNGITQPLDSALEGLVPLFMGENWEWVGQEENYMPCPTEENHLHSLKHLGMESIDSTLECLDTCENSEFDAQKVGISMHMKPNLDIPKAQESKGMVSDSSQNEVEVSLLEENSRVFPGLDTDENFEPHIQKYDPSRSSMLEDKAIDMTQYLDIPTVLESNGMVSELIQNEVEFSLLEEDSEVLSGFDTFENSGSDIQEKVNMTPNSDIIGGMMSELIQNEVQITLPEEIMQDGVWNFWCGSFVGPESLVLENNQFDKEKRLSESELEVSSERPCLGSAKVNHNSPSKDQNRSKMWSFWSGNMGVESSVCSLLSEVECISESENEISGISIQSPPLSSIKRPFVSPLTTSSEKPARENMQSASQILTTRSEEKKVRKDWGKVKLEPLSRALFNDANVMEDEEIFTPDKENLTPNTHRSIRKSGILKDVQNLSSRKVSPLSSELYYEGSICFSSDKENYSRKSFLKEKTARCDFVKQGKSIRITKRNGEERMPFQSLLDDSPQICAPKNFPDASMTKDKFVSERIQKWSMIVDTTTLLNKKSRKALQLLEGLKGTQLIIPKIVIKDLACLKRQTSFFRKNTEVSLALDWIEECMVKTQKWVHVQNSVEEGRSVAPTPPASPYSHVAGPFIFTSVFESQPELLSPTVEDHVLDYALSSRKNKNDEHLVLLSNDVTLKIKAMAEGIICETAEEFRESLVNPFSERFLWTDSSPRGQTWSYSDDFVLRERFYPSSMKMSPKAMENVKGLKLILLHN